MPAVTVLLPCLNEAETLATCVERALAAFEELGVEGEVVVADNGSTDDSAAVAERAGARVVHANERGYGNALMAGLEEARAPFVVLGDADASYDFGELPKFYAKFEEGYEFVQGCRLRSGGGRVLPGAMPLLHRLVGNPLFSRLARLMFRAPVHDVNCGLRGITRDLYRRLEMRCTGMEFAVEMVIKASLQGARIAEVSITLHPDQRTKHEPHLRTFRDGWRTLRYYLISSPRWLYLIPGVFAIVLGLLGYALALPGAQVFGATLGEHTLLVASLAILIGYQAILFGLFARTFAVSEGLMPPSPLLHRLFAVATLERGLGLAAFGLFSGLALIGIVFLNWRASGFGDLDYRATMRFVVPGVTLAALGIETLFSSFLLSMLGMGRK